MKYKETEGGFRLSLLISSVSIVTIVFGLAGIEYIVGLIMGLLIMIGIVRTKEVEKI
jgi:small-conductance mechanosensitive channel